MRRLQWWWYGIVLSSRYNPPQVVEAVMLLLAVVAFLLWWVRQDWQCLVLYVSYLVGTIASILARETVYPSAQSRMVRLTAVGSLVVLVSVTSVCAVKLFHHA